MYKVFKSKTGNLTGDKGGSFFEHIAENKRIFILAAIFAAGMLAGALIVKDNSSTIMMKLLTLFGNFNEIKSQQSVVINFCNSFVNSFIYLAIVYCTGLCAVGTPLIYSIPFVRGLGLGIISGYLYSAYMLKGVGYSLLIILPGVIFYVLVLILACNESILMSKDVLLMLINKENENRSSYKMYCIRYVIFCIVTAVGALIETFFYSIFSGFFIFS